MLIKKESQTAEFKQIWKDEYLKTICAFANSEGGTLYIGIADNGKVVGINNAEMLLGVLPNKINNRLGILVNVELKQNGGKEYLEVKINKTYAPVSVNGKFYKRSGSNTIELNGSNLTNFLLKKYGKTWDDVIIENFGLDNVNLETVEKFKNWSRKRVPFIDEEKDLESLFEKLNLYENGHLKRAAVLLFGKNPQKYFVQAHSKIGKFLSHSEVLTSDIIEGNLFEQLEKIIDILRTKYLKSYISYDNLNRVETLEYPYNAIREAVINGLIHRDYSDTTVLQIRVYNNEIVFTNGATLSQEVPIEQFKLNHISKPFNPVIANMFYKAGFVESWGRGTNNIVEECVKMGLPEPEYKYTFSSVQVIIRKTPLKTPLKTKEQILELIKSDKNITITQMADILGKSRDTINEHIANLKKTGVLQRMGSRKSGYWKTNKAKR